MYFKCVKCKHKNKYLRCHMCREYFYTEKKENPPMCFKCEEECEKLYIETINKKHKIEQDKRKREQTIKNLSPEYKSLLIDFDGE